MAEVKCVGRGGKTWGECINKNDKKLLGLQPEWTVFRDMWRDSIWNKRLTIASVEEKDDFKINDDDEFFQAR